MGIKQLDLCRGDGKLYVLVRTPAVSRVDGVYVNGASEGFSFPACAYPFDEADQCTRWVVELPILEVPRAQLELVAGDDSLGTFRVVFELAKWESRLNYRIRRELSNQIRDYERNFCEGKYQPQIMRFLESDHGVVWRIRTSWKGDATSRPRLRCFDGTGNEIPFTQYPFEIQLAPEGSDLPHSEFVSVELPAEQQYFYLTATDPSGIIKQGFCSINPGAYEAFKYETWKYMKDARADDAAYAAWFEAHRATKQNLAAQAKRTFASTPMFSLVVPCYRSDAQFIRELIDSVKAQSYANWELLLMDASKDESDVVVCAASRANDYRIRYIALEGNDGIVGNTNAGIHAAKGDYIAFLDHDDLLEPDALFWYACAIEDDPDTDLLYCDEDLFEKNGTYRQPVFKSKINPDLLFSHNYITHFLVVRHKLLLELGLSNQRVSGAQDYDVALRVLAANGTIVHVPRLLYHWRIHKDSTCGDNVSNKPYADEAGRIALQEYFKMRGIAGLVKTTEHPFVYRMHYALPNPVPLVSIVIPNKDHIDVLDACLQSILTKATYPNYEIVVVENNSTDSKTFAYYEQIQQKDSRIRVLEWSPKIPGMFNYSAIINHGAAQANGEYLLLLNNDTEVISPDFMQEMLGYLQRPEVGVVGAKLYFRDGLTQHAGIQVGVRGAVAHVNQDFPPKREGYLAKAIRPGNFSAVTGACQMVRASLYREIGGYCEELAVGFNDVDFCFRIRKAGYLVVFTPYAELYHYEFVSRGREEADETKQKRWQAERDFFANRWPEAFSQGDPYGNPNLNRDSAYFALEE